MFHPSVSDGYDDGPHSEKIKQPHPEKEEKPEEQKSLKLHYWGFLSEEKVANATMEALHNLDPDCNVMLSPLSHPLTEHSTDEDLKADLKDAMEECERLAGLVEFWQKKFYETNAPLQPGKIDNL